MVLFINEIILTIVVLPDPHYSLIFTHTHTLLQDMHIISTDEKQVFAAVQEWNQNNTYSLYISDSPGVYFTLSLENLRTSRGPAGNLLVDFYKVCSRCPSRAAAVPFQSNGQHNPPDNPETQGGCAEEKLIFPPPQLFSVHLYQKEEMVLSLLIKDSAFISQHNSLLLLNLLDCGLVFCFFLSSTDFTWIVRLFTKRLKSILNPFVSVLPLKKSDSTSKLSHCVAFAFFLCPPLE